MKTIKLWLKEFLINKTIFYLFLVCIIIGVVAAISGATSFDLSSIGGYYSNNIMVDRASYIFQYFLYFLPAILSFVIVEKTFQEKDMSALLNTREYQYSFILKKLFFSLLVGMLLGLALWGTYSVFTYIIYYVNPFENDIMVPGNSFLFHNIAHQTDVYEAYFADLVFTNPLLFTLYHSFFYAVYQGLWFMLGYGLSLCLKYKIFVYLLLLVLPIMTEYISPQYGIINAFSITVSNVYIINRTLWKLIYTIGFTIVSGLLCLWYIKCEE